MAHLTIIFVWLLLSRGFLPSEATSLETEHGPDCLNISSCFIKPDHDQMCAVEDKPTVVADGRQMSRFSTDYRELGSFNGVDKVNSEPISEPLTGTAQPQAEFKPNPAILLGFVFGFVLFWVVFFLWSRRQNI